MDAQFIGRAYICLGTIAAYVLFPLTVFALPVSGTVQWKKNNAERQGGTAAVAITSVLMTVVVFVYFSIGLIVFAFTAGREFEKERVFADGILEGTREEAYGLQSYIVYRYYEPVSVFLKKTYEPLSYALEQRAGEKYGEAFFVCEADKKREQQETVELYTLYSVEHPEIVMHMFAGNEIYGISDDYLQAKANWLLSRNTDFNEDGTEYAAAIRNTYAVNMETGTVIPSGKQAWEDVGTKEYQAAAGEK